MMHRRRGPALAFLAVLMIAPVTSADWDDEEGGFFFEGGTYFSLGYNWVNEDTANRIGQTSTDKGFNDIDGSVKNAEGLIAVFGQRPWEYLAVEVQFDYQDGFQFTDEDGDHFDLKVYALTLNTKIFPFHALLKTVNEGRIQPHILLGFGGMTTQDLDIDTGASTLVRAGGGLDYYINERWAMNVKSSYIYPFGQLKRIALRHHLVWLFVSD